MDRDLAGHKAIRDDDSPLIVGLQEGISEREGFYLRRDDSTWHCHQQSVAHSKWSVQPIATPAIRFPSVL